MTHFAAFFKRRFWRLNVTLRVPLLKWKEA